MLNLKKVSFYRFLIIGAFFSLFQGLVHPITPIFFKNLNFPDYVFGIVYASTSVGTFLFSPFWGRLGDKIGHAKAFSLSIPIYAASQAAFGLSTTPIMAVITRFISGMAGGGSQVVALAYIVNSSNSENRGKVMSYYVAINGVCSSIGYFVGGSVGNKSIPAVFFIQVIGFCLVSILSYIFIKDPEDEDLSYVLPSNSIDLFSKMKYLMPKSLSLLFITVFLTSLSAIAFDNSFNYYINDTLNLPSTYNGNIKAITGIVGLIANFTINIYLAKNTDLNKSVIIILLMCGILSLATPFISDVNMFFFISIIYYTFNTIYSPIQQVLVMEYADEKSSGVISGLLSSVRSVGWIIGSLVVGFLYSIEVRLPFIVTSAAFFLGTAVSVYIYVRLKKLQENKVLQM